MEKKFNQTAYIRSYNEKTYDRIELKVPKGKKAEWKAKAQADGMSLTEWIVSKVDGENNMYPYEPMPTPEVIHEETIRGAEYKIIKSYEKVPYGEVQDYATGKVKKYGGPTPFYKILKNGETFAKFHSEEESMKHLDKIR